jgi:hypothetical protein
MPGARRILAIALIAMLVAAIAVGALLVALSRGFQRERLRQELEVAASGVLGAPVRIASLEGTLWPEAIARGVSLGPAAAPLAEIDEILLVFDRFDPLARRLVLSQARVRGLDVALDGAWPAPEAAPSGAVADAPNAATGWLRGLEIERVSLEESSGRWESDAGRFSAQLELQGRQAIWPAAPGSLPIARLAIRASVVGALRDEVESQLRIQGTLEAGRLALAILDLRVGDLELALEGEGRAAISDTAIEVEHLRLRSTPGRAQAPKVAADGTEGTLLEIAGGLGLQGYRAPGARPGPALALHSPVHSAGGSDRSRRRSAGPFRSARSRGRAGLERRARGRAARPRPAHDDRQRTGQAGRRGPRGSGRGDPGRGPRGGPASLHPGDAARFADRSDRGPG